MKRITFMLAVSVLLWPSALGACGDDDQNAVLDTTDTRDLEVAFPDGTDGGTDSGVVFDTTAESDSSKVDSGIEDTTVDDSTAEDTTVDDSTAEDTAVPDTTPEDTTVADTTPEDTTVADTTPEDTTVADTAPEDTTLPGCQAGGCTTDIAKGGNSCGNAYVIGRPNADGGNGSNFGHIGTTLGAGNDSDFPEAACGDDRNDRFYQIYLKVGEQLTVTLNPTTTGFDASLSLYAGLACETRLTCVDNDVNQTTPDRLLWQARDMPNEGDGWYTIVVDGRNTSGDYSIVVELDCQEADCCCQ